MIEQYLRPDSIEQALELMKEHAGSAIWFAGGSKLNATPTKTDKTVAISLENLAINSVSVEGATVHIGAMCRVQELIENERVPETLKQSAKFISHGMCAIRQLWVVR